MKLLIAKSVMKEKDFRLGVLFKQFAVRNREELGDIIEYTIDGPDKTIEPYFNGKEFLFEPEDPKGMILLSKPGVKLSDIKATSKEVKIDLTDIDKVESPKEEKTSSEDVKPENTLIKETEKSAKIKELGNDDDKGDVKEIKITNKAEVVTGKVFEVIKPKKIKGSDGKFMKPGTIFTNNDLAKGQSTPARMSSWHWCAEITD